MEITTFRLKVWFLWEYLMFSSNILARIISTREKVSDTRTGETHYGGILLEESTKIELLLPGKLWDNTAPKFIFASLSSPIGYVRCKPCSWLNFCRAYGRRNKIRYCCSSFNFQLHCTTKRWSLQLYIYIYIYIYKKIEKKTEKTNLMHGAQNLLLFVVRHWMRSRVIMTFAFPMEKTCPNGAWLENFSRQILKANRKPKEKINYISNGKKYLNNGVNLSACAG